MMFLLFFIRLTRLLIADTVASDSIHNTAVVLKGIWCGLF